MTPERQPDHRLADRAFARFCANRDPDDLAEVFDRTAPRLILVAMHLTRDAATAEDLLQTTFLEAITAAERCDPRRPVLPWLLTILTRRAHNERRRRGREATRNCDGASGSTEVPDPASVAERRDTHEKIVAAIESLPRPYREVLALRFVHELTPVEISRALDRPVGTVHAQLHRGTERLRSVLPKSLFGVLALVCCHGRGLAAVRDSVIGSITVATSLIVLFAARGAIAQSAPDENKVGQAINKGVTWLKNRGQNFGDKNKRDSTLELVLLTLIHSGVNEDDAYFTKAFQSMIKQKPRYTYRTGLRAMVLEEVDRVKYQWKIAQCAQFLVDNISPQGNTRYGHPTIFAEDYQPVPTKVARKDVRTSSKKPGIIDFGKKPSTEAAPIHREKPVVTNYIKIKQKRPGPNERDHSNMQYLTLGLRACHDSGVTFEKKLLESVYDAWIKMQKTGKDKKMEPLEVDTLMMEKKKRSRYRSKKEKEGSGETRVMLRLSAKSRGWCYGPHPEHKGYGSMSAGAVGAVCILNYMMGEDWREDQNALDGVKWLAKNFSVTGNPGPHEHQEFKENTQHMYYYYIYGLERAGMLFGTERMDDHKWYREGAEELLKQQGKKGEWGKGVLNTCFAILFLKRATRRLDVATGETRRRR